MTGSRYLVKTTGGEEAYGTECDWVLVTFDQKTIQWLAGLKEEFEEVTKRHPEMYSWTIRSGNEALFISNNAVKSLVGEDVFEELQDSDGMDLHLLPDTAQLNLEKFDASSADELVISADWIWWRVFPKHAEVPVSSESIAWSWFSLCAHCGIRRQEHVDGKCLFSSTTFKGNTPDLVSEREARRRGGEERRLSELRPRNKRARRQ